MRKVNKSLCLILLLSFLLGIAGCVVRFRNSEQGLNSSFRRIYLPASTDTSTYGGASARVSYAVRRAMSLRTEISLVALDEARVALDLQILSRSRVTSEQLECSSDETVRNSQFLASGAVPCRTERGFAQAEISAESERQNMTVQARAVDLNTGQVLFTRNFDLASGYPIVSADEDVKVQLRSVPEYHALRYMENADKAVQSMANQVASQIVGSILSLDPSITR